MAKKHKKNSDKTASIVIIAFIGILLLYGVFKIVGPVGTVKVDEDFQQCLLTSDATFYGTEWCSHCKNQKEILGSIYTQYKDQFYVDCDKNQVECNAVGITGYPTWIVDGEQYQGARSIEQLSSILKC